MMTRSPRCEIAREGCCSRMSGKIVDAVPTWIDGLPEWAQYAISGTKILVALSPIIALVYILLGAFEEGEEVRRARRVGGS